MLSTLIAATCLAVPASLRIVSYNIHAGKAVDGSDNIARVAKVILDARADLVALQEVDMGTKRAGGRRLLRELSKATSMKSAFAKAIDFDGGEYGVAVLSRFPIESSRTIGLPSENLQSKGEGRAVCLATINLPGDRKISFASTHLEHRFADLRIAQVAKFSEIPADLPAIVAGDLNAKPDSPLLKQLSLRFTDSFGKSTAATFPGSGERIDYILSDRLTQWTVMEARVLEATGVSDHSPILAVLRLP
jgi:endonuclease/exonuclease/phosphatase family metal-dependent hydrolase